MTLDHAGIAARVPHAGSMCLLDAMQHCSEPRIECTATGHADPAHPLRGPDGLHAGTAIEYAAQAMALHGVLSAAPGTGPTAGFIAAARQVKLHVRWLHDAPGPLRITAERMAGDAGQAVYRFAVGDAGGRLLAEGRVTVVLDRAATPPVAQR